MRIAVWHNLPSGGGKRALHDQVRGLSARGHHVEVWCPDTADQNYLPLSSLATEHVRRVAIDAADDKGRSHGVSASLRRRRIFRARATAMHAHAKECAEEIEQKHFDIVLAHPCRFFLSPHIGRFLRGRKVLYLQEPNRALYEAMPRLGWLGLSDDDQSAEEMDGIFQKIRAHFRFAFLRKMATEEFLNARAFDCILANSFYSAESILRSYGLPARVCYLGVDPSLFADKQLAREDFVVGLGSLHWTKGVDLAIDAIAELAPPRPMLKWIANSSDHTYRQLIEERAREKGVLLEIIENVSDGIVVDVLNRASVMLYTSRLEPFGFAPLEANLCGTPVVAISEGGVRETVVQGVNGCLVPRHAPQIAEALNALLQDPQRARNLGSRAREHVLARWNNESAVTRLEGYLRALVKSKSQDARR